MKKTAIALTIFLMLVATLSNCSPVTAATDGYYQLSEVSQPGWDSTDVSRTKLPTADYDYAYGDEATVTYTLPWSFAFYGQSYNSITADTNGNVWFGATGSAHSFSLASTGRGPVIAAWNNDLSSYFYGGVFVQHKSNPERIVIEWQTETYSDEGAGRNNIFAVVLFSNGAIRVDYGAFNVSTGKDYGSGISSGDGTSSINITSTYGNAFSLAGRSFLLSSGRKIYLRGLTESFGDIITGATSQPHTIAVFNGGTENLLINSVNLTANNSGMFSLVAGGDGCSGITLAPSQACTIQAVFAPTDLGPRNAVLSISSNDPATPSQDITLSGTGKHPTLTVAKGDSGSGTVVSSPAGLFCGTACTSQFATGSIVTISATPDEASAFTGWSGACSGTGDCTVTMDAAKNVTASFTPTASPTVVIAAPSGSTANKRPVLQYSVSTGTVVVKVDGVVVNKVSGDLLDILPEGTHLIRVEATNKAGFVGYAESSIIVDTLPPSVSVSPANGSQNVPINTTVIYTFNEPINAASITKSSITLSSSGGLVPGAVDVTTDARTVTFKPLVQLIFNSDYTANLSASIEDLTGNAVATNYTSTFKTQAASSDLVGLWNLDGDWNDSSGYGRTGTAYGEANFSTDSTNGIMAGSFTGTSDYVSIGNLYGLFPNNTYSLESWVKLTDTGNGGRRTIAGGTGTWSDYSIGLSNNQFVAFVYSGQQNSSGYYAYAGDTPIVGQWYHVAGTFDGSRLKLYVNGELKSDISATWGQSDGGANFWIGSESCCSGNNFNGLIDNVAVYKRALTSEEILAHYTDAPKATLSVDQTLKYRPGDTGTATVTVTHPVGVTSMNCTGSGAASGNVSLTFDLPQRLVSQDFTFQIAPNATAYAAANVVCTSVDTFNNKGSADIGMTVADITVPIVLGSSISDNETNVSATKPFTVNFSKALANETVNTSSVNLTVDDGTNQTVESVVTISADSKSISLAPVVALEGNTAYKLTVSTSVTDSVGNPLAQEFVLHLTTSPSVALNLSAKGTSSQPYVLIGDRYADVLIDNSYVVCDGPVTADSISLTHGSVLSHYGSTTTATYKLEVTAASISVDASSKIDVSGKGYLGGRQGGNDTDTGMTLGNTTTGGSTYYSNGGSYGGMGGLSGHGSANAVYGSMQQPGDLGSGGSANGSNNAGGSGGGLVKVATGALSLNGSIVADGGAVTNVDGGGAGSGGGILLNIGALSGTGTISARGGAFTPGTNYYGSGGGGRIAIYYDTNTLPIANVTTAGGQSGNGSNSRSNGGAGTIYLKGSAKAKGDVIISNGGMGTSNKTAVPGGEYGLIDVKGGAVLVVTGDMTAGTDMVIAGSNLTLNGGITAPGNLTLDGSSVAVAGVVNVTGALTLKNGSVLSHYGSTTTATYKLEVTAASISVDASSKIDVSGKGYLGGRQGGNDTDTGMTLGNTTTGGSTYYSNGGSYGGMGGLSVHGSANAVYGSMQQPGDLGSGGSANGSNNAGGSGGGLVKVTTGALSLNGSIVADGGAVTNVDGGGAGSGGGILLNIGALSGTGTISARGGAFTPGTNYYGSGGGGRIAIYYDTNTLPIANVTTAGGQSGNGSNSRSNGGAGTIYLKDSAKAKGDVIISNGGMVTGNTTAVPGGDYGLVDVKSGAAITMPGSYTTDQDMVLTDAQMTVNGSLSFPANLTLTNSTLNLSGELTVPGNLQMTKSSVTVRDAVNVTGSMTLQTNSVLSHYGATTTATSKLEVTAASISVDASSKIDVSGKGYLGGRQGGNNSEPGMTLGNTTTGGSTYYSNGGSYGGMGGLSGHGSANAVYGSMQQPGDLGSGGSANGSNNAGGSGGGLMKVTTGALSLNGSIEADGGAVTNGDGGGAGSGGGILLNIGALSGTGTISARGGAFTPGTNYYGSGGGGRIAIYYDTNSLPIANVTTAGGQSGNGSNSKSNGGAGTIYLKDSAKAKGDVIISNGGMVTSNKTAVPGGEYGLIDVKGGAVLVVTGDMTAGTDMVFAGSNLTLNGGITAPGNLTLDGSSVAVAGVVNVTGALTLKNGCVLSHYGSTTTATFKLEIKAASISVDASSKIDVSGKGYLGGRQGGNNTDTGMTLGNTTTGGSTYYSNGGSYGGMGGLSGHGSANAVYGSLQQPGDLGSGGSANGSNNAGGSGGGLVKVATGALSLNGSIVADGGAVTNGDGGGAGSGGGILLNIGALSGTGTISARGGAFTPGTNYYGSGGGGRIAIYYDTNTLPTANVIASGGKSDNGSVAGSNGGAGTIYLKDNGKDLSRFGDCDANGAVSISEVQSAIGSFLGVSPASSCADLNGDGSVDISELQKAINGFLGL